MSHTPSEPVLDMTPDASIRNRCMYIYEVLSPQEEQKQNRPVTPTRKRTHHVAGRPQAKKMRQLTLCPYGATPQQPKLAKRRRSEKIVPPPQEKLKVTATKTRMQKIITQERRENAFKYLYSAGDAAQQHKLTKTSTEIYVLPIAHTF
jgi:hypothetical protein